MEKVNITHFNNAHTEWLQALGFYNDEIGLLKERVTEIAGKNTGEEAMKQVEHFENQLTVQKENIETLSHDINTNVAHTSDQMQHSKEGYVDAKLLKQHDLLKERFVAEEKVFNELRQDMKQFAATWM